MLAPTGNPRSVTSLQNIRTLGFGCGRISVPRPCTQSNSSRSIRAAVRARWYFATRFPRAVPSTISFQDMLASEKCFRPWSDHWGGFHWNTESATFCHQPRPVPMGGCHGWATLSHECWRHTRSSGSGLTRHSRGMRIASSRTTVPSFSRRPSMIPRRGTFGWTPFRRAIWTPVR
jgi:hypothetical protein